MGKYRVFSNEVRLRMSASHKGKKLSAEHIKNVSQALMGHPVSIATRRKISASHMGLRLSKEAKKIRNEKYCQKGRVFSVEHKRNLSRAAIGKPKSPEHCRKLSISSKKPYKNSAWVREWLNKLVAARGAKPNKKEILLNTILQASLPGEYELNVKANIMTLGRKIPDFVNINGKKKLIELYGDYWHRGQNPRKRINYFKKFGWDTLVIWERELEHIKSLRRRIVNFNLK